jgi:hypothetical protein
MEQKSQGCLRAGLSSFLTGPFLIVEDLWEWRIERAALECKNRLVAAAGIMYAHETFPPGLCRVSRFYTGS